MKNRRMIFLMGTLFLLTAALAAIHLTTRDTVPEGTLKIETPTQTVRLALSALELSPVKGTVVNGKGEEKAVDAQGILLSALLEQAEISAYQEVTAQAGDAYSASVTAEEIAAPEKVYLIAQEGGGAQMVVFGDANSKRRVSDVICLNVR